MSHAGLWLKAIAENKPLLILEDDAVAHHALDQHITRVVANSPLGWDLIVWGWNLDCPLQLELLPGVTPAQVTFRPELPADALEKFQDLVLSPALYPLRWCFGTPAYSISPAGASKLLRLLLPVRNFVMETHVGHAQNTGLDVALNSVYHQLQAYACFPPLVLTPNNKQVSTVQNHASPDEVAA